VIDADKPEFARILTGLAAIKPGGKLTRDALEIWWAAMQPWTMEDFRAAAAHLAREVEFMPNPHHFEKLRKAARRTSGEAFALARQCWCGGGTSTGDEVVDRVVRMLGGYRLLGLMPSDQVHFVERRFAQHYDALTDADDSRGALPQLSACATIPAVLSEKVAALARRK